MQCGNLTKRHTIALNSLADGIPRAEHELEVPVRTVGKRTMHDLVSWGLIQEVSLAKWYAPARFTVTEAGLELLSQPKN